MRQFQGLPIFNIPGQGMSQWGHHQQPWWGGGHQAPHVNPYSPHGGHYAPYGPGQHGNYQNCIGQCYNNFASNDQMYTGCIYQCMQNYGYRTK